MAMALDFDQLLHHFLEEALSPEEASVFLESVKDPVNQEILCQVLTEKLQGSAYQGLSVPADMDRLFQQMLERTKGADGHTAEIIPIQRPRAWWRFAGAAAAVVLMVSAATIFWIQQRAQKTVTAPPTMAAVSNALTPGSNKAILTLSNGSSILLDSAANGRLAQQGSSSVVKLANGQLSYQRNGAMSDGDILYNTMSTPRGGQYKVILPDGTLVWLNASSSVRYPTAFHGKERKVEVKGEAYFEVVHNAQQPFKVVVNGVAVDVLGTHFNVNGYGDEAATRITLLEGSVKISKGLSSAMLKPGQQVMVAADNNIRFNNGVDVEEAIAWKNGLFWFNGVDLPGIMRQLSRWYDIEVQYEGAIPQRHFTGHVFRDLKLSEVLNILALSHVHFRLEGKKLIVTP
jgi:ferric-dicitrate binding protein FerR (iron transport regulator)